MHESADIDFDKAEAMYRKLEKTHVLMEIFPDGSRVVRMKAKPAAVLINGIGFELRRSTLRFFRWSGGQRVDLTNPKKQLANLSKRFNSVCRYLGISRAPKRAAEMTRKPPTRAMLARAAALDALREPLLRSASLSKAKAAERRLELAATNPEAYLARYRDQLADRGIVEVTKDLHVIALVDSLLQAGVLASVDWRSEPREVKRGLGKLLKAQKIAIAGVWPTSADGQAKDLLRRVSKSLAAKGKRIALIVLRDDSHYFLVVDAKQSREIVALFRRFGAKLVAL